MTTMTKDLQIQLYLRKQYVSFSVYQKKKKKRKRERKKEREKETEFNPDLF